MSPKRRELIKLGNRLNLGISVLQVIWHEFTKFPEYQSILGVSLKCTHTHTTSHSHSFMPIAKIHCHADDALSVYLGLSHCELLFAKCCRLIKMIYIRTAFLVLYYSFRITNNWKHIKHVLSVTSFESAKHILDTEEEVFPTSLLLLKVVDGRKND